MLIPSDQRHARRFRHRAIPVGVSVPYPLRFAADVQALFRVLPHRLEEAVARRLVPLFHPHQRLLDQLCEQSQDVCPRDVVARADGFRRGEIAASGEDRQPPQRDPLILSQERVTPVECRPQCLMPGRHRPTAVGEQVQRRIEAGRELVHREHMRAGSSEFKRERHAIETMTNGGHGGRVRISEGKGGLLEADPVHEQLHRLTRFEASGRGNVRRLREGERGHAPGHLARHAQRLPAGDKKTQARTHAQERIGDFCDHGDEMLAVVQNQQRRAGRERVAKGLDKRAAGFLPDTEDSRNRLGSERRVSQAGELDEPETVRKRWRAPVHIRGSDRTGQARLAASTRPGQREQSGGAEQPDDRRDRTLSADKPGEKHRQIVRQGDGGDEIAPLQRPWLRVGAADSARNGIAGDWCAWRPRLCHT